MQDLLPEVLPAILDGLADESEGVRNAALAAGHTFVDLYATTALPLLLPAVEAGIINDNWRIRQSSVDLLGDLLFKVVASLAIFQGLFQGGRKTDVCMWPSLMDYTVSDGIQCL